MDGRSFTGSQDNYFVQFNPNGLLLSSTYIGGSGEDNGMTMAFAPNGRVIVGGYTSSWNFPIKNVDGSCYSGNYDGFLLQLFYDDIPQIMATPLSFVKEIPSIDFNFSISDTYFNQTQVVAYLDGDIMKNSTWIPNILYGIPVVGLGLGNHNITFIVSDGLGRNNISTYLITVIPNSSPQLRIFGEDLQLFFVNEVFILKWLLTDPNFLSPTFVLYKDYIQTSAGSWVSGSNFILNLTYTKMGRFNYTLHFFDGYGGEASATITVVISIASNDEDGDGMTNGYERRWGLRPFYNDRSEDPDSDTLINYQEFLYSTNPFSADTDGDGYSDAWEITCLSNPSSRWSTPITSLLLLLSVTGLIVVSINLLINPYRKALSIESDRRPFIQKNPKDPIGS